MDRALKERIVGAIVLMVFIVLVVPVFLDGPDPGPAVVSETVTLPGQNGQPRKRQTIVLERDRSEPVPVPAAREGSASSPAGTAQAAPTAAEEPPAAPPAAPGDAEQDGAAASGSDGPAGDAVAGAEARDDGESATVAAEPAAPAASAQSATGMWAVQLGSFSNKDNAERLAGELRGAGYAAFLSRLAGSEGPLHRVRVGPQKDRDSAEAMAARLAADGHRGQVVPHP